MTRTGKFLIYGATGYTGKLTARAAKAQGLTPILAGRSAEKLKPLADELGLESRAFDLAETEKLDAALNEVEMVLHIAGPFSATSKPMADACLRTKTHYLDITGEVDVFESLAARDAEARKAGVMLLPGVGFDVVPSDCLAAHIKRRLPDAENLIMYIGGLSGVSRGTAKTMVEGVAKGTVTRRNGDIETLDGLHEDLCDFGAGPKPTIAVSWGDISTAWHSTKIPNIEVHFEVTPELKGMLTLPAFVKWFLGLALPQMILKRQIDRQPEGPTDAQRQSGNAVLIGVGRNAKGDTVRTRLRTPEGYSLTALTGLAIAKRVLAGDFKAGFQTPSLAYGADFITTFPGVTREDLNA
ncbi:MAG: saccharopine dehydrogenase NADP-binding domain-containing protein [Alphaproteobacteria bacterium]|nr:saccharopine dehydrogenase NADP-binding domain-containing protein [Alphaproteobacteria bacterium]